ncbi:ABC-F family ATP-binding cassette domain-containing protein [Brevibacillus humidisoli]|uniref:ABC-F family ATP-binding cassette domain-containing protein n=1 Tax=Brevibacillus humidisoli TaxID=2895522 RepID=UPI001E371839|nr:ABC-F family ATP-binding cassette domain-containing protein [Brevibacillus humidisoli]UFJ40499.1 ABC-F family ATP-binding cassette domain-containing protein [Brevibacillus humidisoli]
MIQFQHVQKDYGANLVLADVSFEIQDGEKVAVIGRNGAGKTTVFHLLAGGIKPDKGEIMLPKGTKVGLLAQIPIEEEGTSVYDVLARGYREVKALQAQQKELEISMSRPESAADQQVMSKLLQQYGQLTERFERAGGYEMEAHIHRTADGLGISRSDYSRMFSSLSGGEKTKVGLAALLIEQPNLLLLDEPTNHLDMAAIEWLETFLLSYRGTVVVISHDRYFLDKVVSKVIELEDGEAVTYHTNYTGYQQEKQERLLQEFAAYKEQQKKIKKMEETIKRLIEWGNRSHPPNPSFHRRAASMQKALDRMVKLKRPVLERIGKSFGERKLFREGSGRLGYGERVVLIGANGTGKTTLLKIILGEIEPDEGNLHLGARVEIGYLAQEAAPPGEKKTVLHYFREEVGMEEGEARRQLARFLFYGADVFQSVQNLSGGEWSRLRLAVLMHQKPNLLLLDEPTNHLDIDSREALETALEDFPGTIFAVSHDRYFINRIAHKIWQLERNGISVHLGNFDDYQEKKARSADSLDSRSEREGNRRSGAVVDQLAQHTKRTVTVSGHETGNKETMQKLQTNGTMQTVLEQQIIEREELLKQLDQQMTAPENSCDAGKLQQLQQHRENILAELEQLYQEWIKAVDQGTKTTKS